MKYLCTVMLIAATGIFGAPADSIAASDGFAKILADKNYWKGFDWNAVETSEIHKSIQWQNNTMPVSDSRSAYASQNIVVNSVPFELQFNSEADEDGEGAGYRLLKRKYDVGDFEKIYTYLNDHFGKENVCYDTDVSEIRHPGRILEKICQWEIGNTNILLHLTEIKDTQITGKEMVVSISDKKYKLTDLNRFKILCIVKIRVKGRIDDIFRQNVYIVDEHRKLILHNDNAILWENVTFRENNIHIEEKTEYGNTSIDINKATGRLKGTKTGKEDIELDGMCKGIENNAVL